MLAADRLLLETNLRQSAIKLREKELNLFTENFSAVGTQAAVLAGFTTTCLIEVTIPENTNFFAKAILHLFAVISICSNITCVSLSTLVSVWGSGKALRGKDGSMDEAVDGMAAERDLIFRAFGTGLLANLLTVASASWIIMEPLSAAIATIVVIYSGWLIGTNFKRIQKKFQLNQVVLLDDLTKYNSNDRVPLIPSDKDKRDANGLTNRNKINSLDV